MLAHLNAHRRAGYLKWITCLALAASIFIGPTLWHSGRTLPAAPVFKFLPVLPLTLNFILIGTAVLGIVFAAAVNSRTGATVAALSLGCLMLFDINRLQPQFYMMLTVLLICAWGWGRPERDKSVISLLQLVWIAIYFNSGLHKLNPWFSGNTFTWMVSGLEPFINRWPDRVEQIFYSRGWLLVPFSEMAAAVLLLIPQTRKAGFYLGILLHTVIMYTLVIKAQHYLILPWNLLMLLGLPLLFRGQSAQVPFMPQKARLAKGMLLGLYVLLPATHLIELWDAHPSYAIYSGKHKQGYLAVEGYVYEKIPARYRRYITKAAKDNKYLIDLDNWALQEIEAPLYPEQRVYFRYKRFFEQYAAHPADVFLVIIRNGETRIFR